MLRAWPGCCSLIGCRMHSMVPCFAVTCGRSQACCLHPRRTYNPSSSPVHSGRLPTLHKVQVQNTSLCNAAADLAQPGYNLTAYTSVLPLCPPPAPAPAPAPLTPAAAAVLPSEPAVSPAQSSHISAGPIAGMRCLWSLFLSALPGFGARRHRPPSWQQELLDLVQDKPATH